MIATLFSQILHINFTVKNKCNIKLQRDHIFQVNKVNIEFIIF